MTEAQHKPSFSVRLRNNFLTGLIICAPIAITIWLTWTLIQWADSWVKPLIPLQYRPEHYIKFAIPGFGLLTAVIVITIIGFLAKNFIGKAMCLAMGGMEKMIGGQFELGLNSLKNIVEKK